MTELKKAAKKALYEQKKEDKITKNEFKELLKQIEHPGRTVRRQNFEKSLDY
jgi:hypothetical protein